MWVIGNNLGHATFVLFSGHPATIVEDCATSIKVTVPSGLFGTPVDLAVLNSFGNSNTTPSDVFTATTTPSGPTVTGVYPPDYGHTGISVDVVGRGFTGVTAVKFGTVSATSYTVDSSSYLTATVPSGGGSVNVTVTVSGRTSPTTWADLFTYGTLPAAPTVTSVSPDYGLPGSTVTIDGNYLGGPTFTDVYFGGTPASSLTFITSNEIKAVVPSGGGMVDLTVSNSLGTSFRTTSDLFTYGAPPPPSPTTVALPLTVSAQPFWMSTGEAFLGSNVSDSQLTLYSSTNGGVRFSTTAIAGYNASTGSALFNRIGNTQLTASGLIAGQVAAASENGTIFGVVTTILNGETVLESVASQNGGVNWTGPCLEIPAGGALASPSIAIAPYGNPYVSVLNNNGGTWRVDQIPFSAAGAPLMAPQALPASPGSNAGSPQYGSASVAFDGLGRSLYAWSESNGTLGYTGGFLSAPTVTSLVQTGLNATVPADFPGESSSQISSFESSLEATADTIQHDSTSGSLNLCGAETLAYRSLEPNATRTPALVQVPGPLNRTSCTLRPVASKSILANSNGSTEPTGYLGIYSEWLDEALGVGTLPASNWTGTPLGSPVPESAPPNTAGTFRLSPTAVNATDSAGDGERVQVDPVGINPNAVWLDTSGVLKTSGSSYILWKIISLTQKQNCGYNSVTDVPVRIYTNVTYLDNAHHKLGPAEYVTESGFQQVFLTNLTTDANGSWWENLSILYQQTYTHAWWCTSHYAGNVTEVQASTLHDTRVDLAGIYTTGLSFSPYPPIGTMYNYTSGGQAYADDNWTWTNTVLAQGRGWINGTSTIANWNEAPYVSSEQASFSGVPIAAHPAHGDNVMIKISTVPGGYNVTWPGQMSAAQVTSSSPAEVSSWGCSFNQEPMMIGLQWNSTTSIVNVTTSSATLTWYSNQSGLGWVRYIDTYGGWTEFFSADASITKLTSIPGWIKHWTTVYEYTVELDDLDSWAAYSAQIGVGQKGSCFTYTNSTTWTFQTDSPFSLSATDLPYDSITQQGGGEVIGWSIPTRFVTLSTFQNGTLYYWPTNETIASAIITPFTNSTRTGSSVDGSGATYANYALNLTALSLNWSYDAELVLNYSTWLDERHVEFTAASSVGTFQYEKDSSGDGLTDAEKRLGWDAAYQSLSGWQTLPVNASPALYSTNGIANDYIEKEYGLDPRTVDTAGSDMLDLYNLTFDLGANSSNPVVPYSSLLPTWSEVGNGFNPFTAKPYPNAPYESNYEIGSGTHSNITCTSSKNCAGDSAYSSEVLWSRTALSTFLNLSGVEAALSDGYLRGVLGVVGSERTLTLWGKLSWGANPLATSTPDDGIADGARVNPLTGVGLEFSGVSANLPAGEEEGSVYSVQMAYRYWTPQHGFLDVSNYSTTGAAGGGVYQITNYSVALPVGQVNQTQTIQLEVGSWASGTFYPDELTNNTHLAANVTYDLVAGAKQPVSFSDGYANIHGNLTVLPLGTKDPTWLWIPTDNSTVNGLPLGLERYTGEQSFDLVVVDATSNWQSQPIPLPWGGDAAATINLSAGLNDFLIPRAQFVDSPFGQAVLLGQAMPYNSSNPYPALVGTSGRGVVSPFDGTSHWMDDLAAYWQNRSLASTSGASPISSNETGIISSNALNVNMTVVTNASSSNAGGVPSETGVYNASDTPPAIQSIFTLNITNQTTLDLLLAGLFDNSSGGSHGVNGTFESVTYQVQCLGLDEVVVNAVPNVSVSSDGLYGPYTGGYSGPSGNFWGDFWNAVSSVIESPVGTVLSLATIVWNGAVAIATYVDYLAHEAVEIGAQALGRTWRAIVSAGDWVEGEINAFLSWLKAEVTGFFARPLDYLRSTTLSSSAAYGEALTSAEGIEGSYTSPRTTEDWNTATSPGLASASGVSSALQSAFSFIQPYASILGPIAGFIMTCVYRVLGQQAQSDQSLSNYPVLSTWADIVEAINVSALAIVGHLGLSSQSVDELDAGVFALTVGFVVTCTALVSFMARYAQSPAGVWVALLVGMIALVLAFVLTQLSPGSIAYTAVAVTAFCLGLGAAYLDIFSAAFSARTWPQVAAGAAVGAFDGGAIGITAGLLKAQ